MSEGVISLGSGLRAPAILVSVVMVATAVPMDAPVRVERKVVLMGTMAHLIAEDSNRNVALNMLEHMVRAIEDVEQEISTWRDDSVISRLNRHPPGKIMTLPARSCALLRRAAYWQHRTQGAFDPAVGRLIQMWGLRSGGRLPDAEELEHFRQRSGWDKIRFDSQECVVTRLAEATLDMGAFGKGAALDEVRRIMEDYSGAWMIDFGGQVAVSGAQWAVALAHPLQRAEPVMELMLTEGSIATSGGSERDVRMDDGSYVGHVLDPRTGRTVHWHGSVSVCSASGLDADVLSTALRVMGPEAGFEWAVRYGIAANFLIIEPDGQLAIKPTPEFQRRFPVSQP